MTGLFQLEPRKRTRVSHREDVREMKLKHGIYTHLCRGGGEWLALSMPECIERLNGYDLTDEEKTNGVALMAGYCRLLDEAGLVEQGHKTEYAACLALVARIERKAAPMSKISLDIPAGVPTSAGS